MKIIITKDQFNLINENYRRDRWDAEYGDEYPKYKKLFIKMLKQDVKSGARSTIQSILWTKKGMVYSFIDDHPKPYIMIILLTVKWKI